MNCIDKNSKYIDQTSSRGEITEKTDHSFSNTTATILAD
ncbi:hypothetical protein M595_0846 [Lyngbya aestuarii BL J]|uniref:Uncharacterized protein n=1 Tax=Lyngbya aestuarii BL J TaxID=1348334 RepID=U7QPX2_9CYAN|nr:hypothetical protein M595_0846 [Lyngbya aestuarii BL J]